MKKLLVSALILLIIVQLFVPVSMIANKYDILNNGAEYKFKVEPIDPYDAFRGRYVYIHPPSANIEVADDETAEYALLKRDDEGFAYIHSLSDQKPEGADYVKGESRYGRFRLPIDRYYMDENLAPSAEKLVRGDRKDAYVTVRVKNGQLVVSGLYVDGIAIEEYVKQHMEDIL